MTEQLDFLVRVVIIVAGFMGAGAVGWLIHIRANGMGSLTALRMAGGALLCFSVATGTLAILFGLESIWRLPFLAVSVIWVAVGGIGEIIEIRKRRG